MSLHNSKLKAIFGDTEDGVDTFCRYEQMPGYLKIWPSKEVPVETLAPDYSNEESYAEAAWNRF